MGIFTSLAPPRMAESNPNTMLSVIDPPSSFSKFDSAATRSKQQQLALEAVLKEFICCYETLRVLSAVHVSSHLSS